ncbi:MAG: response regulator transcription factor [Chloroflexi bacterium AL-W]|nr:response regulator transcription factor [Chloroflexi bacterium AL-N1]NOK69744.1 response regulator transcription factor [Chloroflexi bacterium AL-N10]NOK73652.1 response regulator transcription factor [Chloroflexi bacterium AL-N5]NOK83914.1 response regulator transcription factor [Chloroflexi bacterium AL-W]NOK87983.1 response regulator transcription factor [Chloroflexi bacterium AL-N15]
MMIDQSAILLVDDETAITDNLTPLLERTCFTVTIAVDGAVAMQALGAQSFALVILDVLMPRLDG